MRFSAPNGNSPYDVAPRKNKPHKPHCLASYVMHIHFHAMYNKHVHVQLHTHLIEATSRIPMSASLRDKRPTGKDPRPWNPSILDSLAHSQHITTGVPNGRESLLEIIHAVLSAHRTHGHHVEVVTTLEHALLDAQMRVHIDQTRHQRLSLAIHHCNRIVSLRNLEIKANLFNHVVANQEVGGGGGEGVGLAVKDSRVAEENDLGGGLLVGRAPLEGKVFGHWSEAYAWLLSETSAIGK
mmetsp:Transcript_12106/g.25066  ORF Transcript_12106/g.25066 Transcript_12106/m.25066 type:complete len:239 (-) Transcript_12106:43-759(-)